MKPIEIDFIPDARWKWIWGFTAVACAAMLSYAGWRWQQAHVEHVELRARITAIKKELTEQTKARIAAPDLRAESKARAAKLLQLDLNKVFATVEGMAEQGSQLRSMQMDAATNTIRLEYDLDSVARASTVTAVLNSGRTDRPWRFEGLAASSSATGNASSSALPVRAQWVAGLDAL